MSLLSTEQQIEQAELFLAATPRGIHEDVTWTVDDGSVRFANRDFDQMFLGWIIHLLRGPKS